MNLPRPMNRRQPTAPATYEGRALPRPDEDLDDQGLTFDLGTMSRRNVLATLGLGAGAAVMAACGAGSIGTAATTTSAGASAGSTSTSGLAAGPATAEIPDETAGPYPGDGSNGPDALTTSGVVRSDIRSSFGGATGSAQGVPLTFTLAITDLAKSAPMVGAAVYAWHCDREGRYSLYSSGITEQNYLRGVQVTDAGGEVTFTSIFPACYSGRWPHIHFEVYPSQATITDAKKAIATSQLALPKSVCDIVYATSGYEASVANLAKVSLATDNVFGNDGGKLQLASVSGDVTKGYTARLVAGVDTRTTPTVAAAPAGGGRNG